MNPEKLTTSQIYHALTPKHMVAIIAAVVALLSAALWLGQTKNLVKQLRSLTQPLICKKS